MKIGILGSGQVAQALGGKLLQNGHNVMISSRDLNRKKETWGPEKLPSVNEWIKNMERKGYLAHGGSFKETAVFGEVLMNCTRGLSSIEVLKGLNTEDIEGKILIDTSNPLDSSAGFPPVLGISNTESLGERIQEEFPGTRVVKALNMVNAEVMAGPDMFPEETHLMIAGNDPEAKEWVTGEILRDSLGWKNVVDLGDISNARGMEMYLALWIRLMNAMGTAHFNIKLVKSDR
jgi:predicted dinucleotide-binding enzyme